MSNTNNINDIHVEIIEDKFCFDFVVKDIVKVELNTIDIVPGGIDNDAFIAHITNISIHRQINRDNEYGCFIIE